MTNITKHQYTIYKVKVVLNQNGLVKSIHAKQLYTTDISQSFKMLYNF